MLFVIAAGVADVFAMAKGLGIPPSDALAVFSKFQPAGVIKSRGEKMARGDFSATLRADDGAQGHAADARGRRPESDRRAALASRRRMDEAIAKGHGQDDLGAIAAEVVR